MTTLLVVGDDKIGRRLLHRLGGWQGTIVLDRSSNLGRAWRLLRRGSLTYQNCLQMAWANLCRPDFPAPDGPAIRSNAELLKLILAEQVEQVFLFRAGLIVSKSILGLGVDVLNVHCARIPEYGGLGSLPRALADGACDQVATLHRVTERIDRGEVLDTEPYNLDPTQSFRWNEDIAYEAGIRLLSRHLAGEAYPVEARGRKAAG